MIGGTELQKRAVTAVIGIAVLLLVLIFGGALGTRVFAFILSVGMLWEFADLAFRLPDQKNKRSLLLFLAGLFHFFDFYSGQQTLLSVGIVFVTLFTYFLWSARLREGAEFLTHAQELMYSVFGFIYLALIPLFLCWIREMPEGLSWVLFFLVLNWASDIGAYVVGKVWGRHKLYPLISPKKTYEGAIGGFVWAAIVVIIYRVCFFGTIEWLTLSLVAFAVVAIAQVGDLCESLLKRAFDKKDSGSLLPGHGGFMDRFDGVVFALPIMYACLKLIG
jgi:phosphatidate cytidylyltransferase